MFLSHKEVNPFPIRNENGEETDFFALQGDDGRNDPAEILIRCEAYAQTNGGSTMSWYNRLYCLPQVTKETPMTTAMKEALVEAGVKPNGNTAPTEKKTAPRKKNTATPTIPEGMKLVPENSIIFECDSNDAGNRKRSVLQDRFQEQAQFLHYQQVRAAFWVALMLVDKFDVIPTPDEVKQAVVVTRTPEEFVYCRDDVHVIAHELNRIVVDGQPSTRPVTNQFLDSQKLTQALDNDDWERRDNDTRKGLSTKQLRMVLENSLQYLSVTVLRNALASGGFTSERTFDAVYADVKTAYVENKQERERAANATRTRTADRIAAANGVDADAELN